MPKLNFQTAAKAYLLTVITVGMLVSPIPQLTLAIMLFAIQVYTTYKPPTPKISIALTMSTLILTPLTLIPLMGSILSALPIIPAVYLIDQNLHQNSSTEPIKETKKPRTPTHILTILTAALSAAFVASLLLLNMPLILATSILLIYLAAVVTYNLCRIPQKPIKESKTWNRILVGNTESSLITLSTQTQLPLNITLSAPQPWINVKPENTKITQKNQVQINITYTPPLAGPTKLQLQCAAVDPRGLIQINQPLEPVGLHIIPKAKYAQWLAKKYLEQTASGAASTVSTPPRRSFNAARSSVEFYGSRFYQPGDRLKDVDWKHTIMIDELIVKEFAGVHGTPTIIVADMIAKDEQDADKLIHNMVMAALTAATESLPSGLACFNQKQVLAATAPTNPRETLKKTLQIIEKTTISLQPNRIMKPQEIQKLKITLRKLNEADAKPTKRFTEILGFERQAIQTAAKQHPATEALTKSLEKTPAPAMITVASKGNGDAEALAVSLEKLKERGYSIVTV
jgi:hypothetical protein